MRQALQVTSALLVYALAVGCGGGGGSDSGGVLAPDAAVLQDSGATPEGDTVPGPDDAAGAPDIGSVEVAPAECDAGDLTCADDGNAVLRCTGDGWLVFEACRAGFVCLDVACVTAGPCEGGDVRGCLDDRTEQVCDPTGIAWLDRPCDDGALCFHGLCQPARCVPGSGMCMSPSQVSRCRDDGQGFAATEDCPLGTSCEDGACFSACGDDPKYRNSYVGCVFWSADLGQWHVREGDMNLDPDAAHIPHAVVIANPGDRDAAVGFGLGDGTTLEVADPVVPAGGTRAFLMPEMSLQETAVTQLSIRVSSTQPVTAAQFNPPTNEDFVHTSDASLLLPQGVAGREYIAVSGPSVIGLTMPPMPPSPSVFGYFTVIAVSSGTTEVSFTPTSPTEPGPEIPELAAGETHRFALETGEVLHVQAKGTNALSMVLNDLTGTVIAASQPVVVFGGHDCLNVYQGNCDHCETQLLPISAWGRHYVAGRMDTLSPNVYRVVSGEDGNRLTTRPPIAELDGVTLDKGAWVEVPVGGSFEIEGSGRLQVVQFIAGNDEGGAALVDPSMAALVPTAQFRADYPILVPAAYEHDRVNIVRPAGVEIRLDGVPVADYFQPVGSGDWEVANVTVSDGVRRLTGNAPFGVVAYGYASKVSYAYPAGLDAATLDVR